MVRWCEINPTDVLFMIHTHLQKVRSPVCTGRVGKDEGPFFSAENVIEIIIMRGNHTISSMITIQAVVCWICHGFHRDYLFLARYSSVAFLISPALDVPSLRAASSIVSI